MSELHAAETALSVALARREFDTRRHGYDRKQVDDFVDQIAASAAALVEHATAAATAATPADPPGARDDGAVLARVVEDLRAAQAVAHAELEVARARIAALERDAERDSFAEMGVEVAAVLRAAHEAARAAREEAEAAAEEARREADELARGLLAEAESRLAEAEAAAGERLAAAEAEARRVVAQAREETDRMVAEARARTDHLSRLERDLREGLEAAAGWILHAAREPLSALPQPAATGNGGGSETAP